jgi:integrase
MSKLTAVQIRNAKPKGKPYKLSDGHGLYFHVAKSGKKTWRYRYKIAGTESTFTLGEYPFVSLEQARACRVEAREQVKAGKNPSKERRAEKEEVIQKEQSSRQVKENTFEFVALEWIEQQQGRWSKAHADAVLATLRRDAFLDLGRHSVEVITPPMVLEVVRKIEKRGALEIAHKVLQRINATFRYAVQTGKATYNPAADMKGVLKSRKVTHMTSLTREDLPEFLKTLTSGDIHVTTKLALQFTILTAARTGEVRGTTWDEIDFDEKLWKIPAKRMKMDAPHNIPLSKHAVAVLERVAQLYGKDGHVFPGIRQGSKQLSENTMLYALYRLGYHSKATVHGFRATFSTIANESGFDGDVIEKALAHEQRNRVRAAYHRSEYIEQRRVLMQWWADLLQQMEYGGEIIPIRQEGNN